MPHSLLGRAAVAGPGLGDLVRRAGCAHASLVTDEFLDIVLGDVS